MSVKANPYLFGDMLRIISPYAEVMGGGSNCPNIRKPEPLSESSCRYRRYPGKRNKKGGKK